jgi:hypothetical protein
MSQDIEAKIRQADVDMWASHARIVLQATAAIAEELKQIIIDYQDDPSTGVELYYQRIGDYIVTKQEEAIQEIRSLTNQTSK